MDGTTSVKQQHMCTHSKRRVSFAPERRVPSCTGRQKRRRSAAPRLRPEERAAVLAQRPDLDVRNELPGLLKAHLRIHVCVDPATGTWNALRQQILQAWRVRLRLGDASFYHSISIVKTTTMLGNTGSLVLKCDGEVVREIKAVGYLFSFPQLVWHQWQVSEARSKQWSRALQTDFRILQTVGSDAFLLEINGRLFCAPTCDGGNAPCCGGEGSVRLPQGLTSPWHHTSHRTHHRRAQEGHHAQKCGMRSWGKRGRWGFAVM